MPELPEDNDPFQDDSKLIWNDARGRYFRLNKILIRLHDLRIVNETKELWVQMDNFYYEIFSSANAKQRTGDWKKFKDIEDHPEKYKDNPIEFYMYEYYINIPLITLKFRIDKMRAELNVTGDQGLGNSEREKLHARLKEHLKWMEHRLRIIMEENEMFGSKKGGGGYEPNV